MEDKIQKKIPYGLLFLCIFYGANSFLFIFTSVIFFNYLDIIILGKILSSVLAAIIRLILIILPVCLILGISFRKKRSYRLAIVYHLFFIINGALMLFCLINKKSRLKPLLEIALKPEHETNQIIALLGPSYQSLVVQILSIVIGSAIIIFLYKKRGIFTR